MRTYWWRVITGVLLVAAGILLLLGQLGWISLGGEAVGTLALFGGSAIFLALWLSDTRQWWPTIPGGIMLAWGVSALFGLLGVQDWLVALIGMLGSALPFLYIYLRDRGNNWWALIPGGIFILVGLATALGDVLGGDWVAAFVLWGIALAFVLVFIADRRNWWSLVPAGVLAVVGMGVSPFAPSMLGLLAAALIVIGAGLVLRALFTQR